ncbi:MAG: glycosyltransferase family 39 protein [Anaerolineaceae bacterium]|nr:glycosyltransferase family 39 protein [Anaerolineaceae bacterium]
MTKTKSETNFLFGLSLQRLGLITGLFVITFFTVILLIQFLLDTENILKMRHNIFSNDTKKKKILLWLLFLIYLLWLLFTLPDYRLAKFVGKFMCYWQLLEPLLLTLFINAPIIFLTIYLFEPGAPSFSLKGIIKNNWRVIAIIILLIASILVGLKLMGQSILFDSYYWNVAGVPILVEYVYLYLGFALFYPAFKKLYKFNKNIQFTNFSIFIILWLLTILIIQPLPITRSTLVLSPLTVGDEYIPRADSQRYDMYGQAFINGFGIGFGKASDKPIYEAYLGLLHFFMGDKYQRIMRLNVVILSFIPAFLYLIGQELESKNFGISLAVFGILIERTTNLSSGIISNIHWKLMMPEPLAQLIILIATYAAIRWLKTKNYNWLVCAGAVIGIGAYIRPQAFLLLIGLIFILIIDKAKNISRKIRNIFYLICSFLTTTLPWAIYCKILYGYIPLYSKFTFILETRILPVGAMVAPAGKIASFSPIFNLLWDELVGNFQSLIIVASHFFNNIIKALLILPYTLEMHKIPNVYDSIVYWDDANISAWDGKITFIFFINLAIFIVGLVLLVRNKGLVGAIPISFMTFYFIGLSLSRTSGSRYLVPVNWVVSFYYLYALYTLIKIILSKIFGIETSSKRIVSANEKTQMSRFSSHIAIYISIFAGLLFPFLDYFIPQNYDLTITEDQVNSFLYQKDIVSNLGVSQAEWMGFINSKNIETGFGEIIYPIIMDKDYLDNITLNFSVFGNHPLRNIDFRFSQNEYEELSYDKNHFVIACKELTRKPAIPFLIRNVETNKIYFSPIGWDYCYQTYFQQ